MFRKITMAALASAAFAMMFCGSDFSGSQAFAKGGRGSNKRGHSVHNSHRRGSEVSGIVHRSYFRSGIPYFYAYDGYVTPGIRMSAVVVAGRAGGGGERGGGGGGAKKKRERERERERGKKT